MTFAVYTGHKTTAIEKLTARENNNTTVTRCDGVEGKVTSHAYPSPRPLAHIAVDVVDNILEQLCIRAGERAHQDMCRK